MKNIKILLEMVEFTLKGSPIGKKNKYRRGKYGGMYKPDDVLDWEWDMLSQIRKQKIPKMAGKFEIEMQIYFKDNRSDLDNAITSILDLLVLAKVLDDDRNVLKLTADKAIDKKNPRCNIQIELIKELK